LGLNGCFKVPSGPFTETSAALTATSTPVGTGTGIFPILDIV
jgi:hypothetical protein